MSEFETPPVLIPPVQQEPGPAGPPPPNPPRESIFEKRLKRMGPIGVFLATLVAKIKTLWSVAYLGFKVLKFGKIFVTLFTMIVSIGFYTMVFGFQFAVGFVILIFIHEMGHVFVAWRQGLPISAPVFIPFFGALIFNKRGSKSAWAQAIMGIGGPVAGGLGALLCLGIYFATDSPMFLALASYGFFLNLFNLMPIVPLDGGWIVGAVSPWLWLVGLIGLIAMTVTGHMWNPMIWILVLLSLPRIWSLYKPAPGQFRGILLPPTMVQRCVMGVCYFALAGGLMVGMGFSEYYLAIWRESNTGNHRMTPVARGPQKHNLGPDAFRQIPNFRTVRAGLQTSQTESACCTSMFQAQTTS